MKDEELEDLIDTWHLTYTGDQSLEQFMAWHAGWSLEDTTTWLETGVKPNENI